MNPLNQVLEWYEIFADSQKIIAMLVAQSPELFPDDVVFATEIGSLTARKGINL